MIQMGHLGISYFNVPQTYCTSQIFNIISFCMSHMNHTVCVVLWEEAERTWRLSFGGDGRASEHALRVVLGEEVDEDNANNK